MTANAVLGLVALLSLLSLPLIIAESIRDRRRFLEVDRKYRATLAANIRKHRNAPDVLDNIADIIDPEKNP